MNHQNLANLTTQYQSVYLVYCYKVMQYLQVLAWLAEQKEPQNQTNTVKVKPKSASGVKKIAKEVNQKKPVLKSLKHQEKLKVNWMLALGFPNGAMSAAFRVAFNDGFGSFTDIDDDITKKSVTFGDSTFEYSINGPVEFQETVHQLLVDIASSDSGATLLNEISANGGNVYIGFRSGKQASTQGFITNRNSNIRLDPNFKEAINSNIGPLYANPTFILAHELHHAWKNTLNCWLSCNRSLVLPGKIPRGIPPVEMHALRYTNRIRTELNAGYQRKF